MPDEKQINEWFDDGDGDAAGAIDIKIQVLTTIVIEINYQ